MCRTPPKRLESETTSGDLHHTVPPPATLGLGGKSKTALEINRNVHITKQD